MNNTEKEGYSEKEKKIEKWSKEWIINCVTQAKGKKDTYIILLLIGILLFIIALPVRADTTKQITGTKSKQESLSQGVQSGSDNVGIGGSLGVLQGKVESNIESNIADDGTQNIDNRTGVNGEISTANTVGTISSDGKTESYTEEMESRLADILTSMAGVGKVKVMITINTSTEKVVEKDQPNNRSVSTETDSSGSNRNVNDMVNDETTVYIKDSEGNEMPYVVKQLEPKVEGVMVVAEGAGNASVNKNITDVIQALFGIEAHKIVVVKMKT
ncbi:MAG: hypothetical protein PHS74_01700 [Lachnospiraceae bacterium]|nr:hypothetical protein [Lachnospiraceae bacterium]